MDCFFNKKGELDIRGLTRKSTVEDFLQANRIFLRKNPLACLECEQNCCQQGWDIELDLVFVNKMAKESNKNLKEIINELTKMNKLKRPVFKQNPCFFLQENGFCSCYSARPFICRTFTCYNEAENYIFIRNIILRILNLALINKINLLKKDSQDQIKNTVNIFLDVDNYNININLLLKKNPSYINRYEYDLFDRLLN